MYDVEHNPDGFSLVLYEEIWMLWDFFFAGISVEFDTRS